MAEIYLTKRYGSLMPASELDAEKIYALADGDTFKCSFTRPRNIKFHNKYFALLDVLFECFEPELPAKPDGISQAKWEAMIESHPPTKNRERFRKDIAIVTGHYDLVVRVNGDVRAEARSISFASMDETEFSRLYSATIDYGLAKVAKNKGRSEIENWVQQIMDFA